MTHLNTYHSLRTQPLFGCVRAARNKSQKSHTTGLFARKLTSQAAQTLFVIYIRDSIALRFEPFKRMYENGSKIALN